MVRRGELPGLQAERTILAWDRTALGLLANGALLLFRDVDPFGAGRLLPAAAALVLALYCAVLGRRRASRIGHIATDVRRDQPAVLVLGWGVAALGLAVIVLLAL